MATMKKTAHYRLAAHVGKSKFDLMLAVGHCSDSYPKEGYPIFEYVDDMTCAVVSHLSSAETQQLHLAIFEQGAGAAVVDTIAQIRVGEEPAPEMKEFIKSQIFLVISKNDVIYVTHNSHLVETRISLLLNGLINKFSLIDEPPKFLLRAVIDDKIMKQMLDDGIGELEFGVNSFKQTVEYLINDGGLKDASLFSFIKSLFQDESKIDGQIKAAEKLSGMVVMRPGKNWEQPAVKELTKSFAAKLIETDYEDGFTIKTKKGMKITPKNIKLSEEFKVEGNKQVIDGNLVFEELNSILGKFKKLGVLGEEMLIDDE